MRLRDAVLVTCLAVLTACPSEPCAGACDGGSGGGVGGGGSAGGGQATGGGAATGGGTGGGTTGGGTTGGGGATGGGGGCVPCFPSECSSGEDCGAGCQARTPFDAGIQCGGGVCDGLGVCVPCTPGFACSASACRVGQQACDQGPRCEDVGPVVIGTSCDAGVCGASGTCGADSRVVVVADTTLYSVPVDGGVLVVAAFSGGSAMVGDAGATSAQMTGAAALHVSASGTLSPVRSLDRPGVTSLIPLRFEPDRGHGGLLIAQYEGPYPTTPMAANTGATVVKVGPAGSLDWAWVPQEPLTSRPFDFWAAVGDDDVIRLAGSADVTVKLWSVDQTGADVGTPVILGTASTGPGQNMITPRALAVAPDGSVYIAGTTFGAGTLGALAFNDATFEAFLMRITPSGTVAWVRRPSAGSGEDFANGVVALADGTAVVSVDFTGATMLGNMSVSSAGGSDVALLRYDSAGAVTWVVRGSGPGIESVWSLTPSGSGVLASGLNSVTFGNLALPPGAWVLQVDANGTIGFARSLGEVPNVRVARLVGGVLDLDGNTGVGGDTIFSVPLANARQGFYARVNAP